MSDAGVGALAHSERRRLSCADIDFSPSPVLLEPLAEVEVQGEAFRAHTIFPAGDNGSPLRRAVCTQLDSLPIDLLGGDLVLSGDQMIRLPVLG